MTGNTLRGFSDVIQRMRALTKPLETRPLSPAELDSIGMGERPRDPLHGSPEANAYAFGLMLARNYDNWSALADLVVKGAQEGARE